MKRFLIIILSIFVSYSILSNIKTQYSTLKEAEKQNLKISHEISQIKIENQILKQKIEYATSSAFIEQEARDKFGLGRENDNWIREGEDKNINLYPKANLTTKIPTIKEWINLFTQ